MKKNETPTVEATAQVEQKVNPLQKSYMLISSRHVDYNNLTAMEAVTMSMALVLSVTLGVLTFMA